MSRTHGFTQLQLERYVLNELSPTKKAEIDQARLDDAVLSQQIEAIRQGNQNFVQKQPAESAFLEVSRRMCDAKSHGREMSSWLTPFLVPASGLALVCVAALLILPLVFDGYNSGLDLQSLGQEDDIRLKGMSPQLHIYREHNKRVEALPQGAFAGDGDILQLSYSAAGKPYGAIFSIDGRGNVTLHFPESLDESTQLQEQGEVRLAHAYQLDDAPSFERFFFITSNEEILVNKVLLVAQELVSIKDGGKGSRLELESSMEQYSITILKTEAE